MSDILEIRKLCKSFGGLVATDDVSLTVCDGEIHALIGPNGAGKSTLINQLCGEMPSNSGSVHMTGQDITRMTEPERVAMGLSRTFQIASLLETSTVRENVGLAVQAHMGGNMRIWDRQSARRDVWSKTDEMLGKSLLANRADIRIEDLSHGEKKQLELVMALAGEPSLLLLDEPMAGLGQFESQQMIEMLNSLRGTCAMLLVEHDMEAVYALADRISVLVYGRVIMTGTAEQIRQDPTVREAYLGAEDE
ncbi:MAG: ABC transporter ATP-binding protein [Pseudodonghicola sp.]|nr:ABC transporter ATP-binding protein [Pseudodonghicola sp.]